MPISLHSIVEDYRLYIDFVRSNLPENIIDISLQANFLHDKLDFVICVKGRGIFTYGIGRGTLENSRPSDIAFMIQRFLDQHLPKDPLVTEAGADEYDEIMQAQDVMAQITPQS